MQLPGIPPKAQCGGASALKTPDATATRPGNGARKHRERANVTARMEDLGLDVAQNQLNNFNGVAGNAMLDPVTFAFRDAPAT